MWQIGKPFWIHYLWQIFISLVWRKEMTINITFYYFLLSLQNILGCGLVDRIGGMLELLEIAISSAYLLKSLNIWFFNSNPSTRCVQLPEPNVGNNMSSNQEYENLGFFTKNMYIMFWPSWDNFLFWIGIVRHFVLESCWTPTT